MNFKSNLTTLFVSLIFFISTGVKVFAQYEELQNNPSVSWIAEFTTDHSFSLDVASSEEVVKLIKFYDDPASTLGANQSNWVIDWLTTNALNGNTECYKDPGLTLKLSESDLNSIVSSVDTVITFDPETYKESVMIVRNDLPIQKIKKLRTNQIIYYNSKSGDFETKLIAVAPLFAYEEKGSLRPLFWIKMNTSIPQKFNLHAPEITWGVLAYTKAHPMELNFIEEVKNTSNFDFNTHIRQQGQEVKKPIESSQYFGCKEFLTKREIENMYSSIDTVTTFDPETFEEEILIVKNEIEPDDVSRYRLVQEWYYDTQKKKLMNRLKGIAPIVNVKDENGNFKYSKPLYYIRYNSWQ